MEALCFYYNEHELANVNVINMDFKLFDLPEQPEVDYYLKEMEKK